MSRLVLVFLLLAAVSRLHAQDDDTVASSSVGVSSRQIFRGVELSGAGAQGALRVARNGWRIDAGFNQPFDHDEPAEGNLTAGYAWRASGPLKLEAIVTQRWRSEALPGMIKHSFEAGLSATWTLPDGFAVELAGLHDIRLQANTLQATLNYSMPLKTLGAYLEWSASIGTSEARDLLPDTAGPPVRDYYSYYTVSVRLPYRIGRQTTLAAGLHVSESANQSRSWSPIGARGGAQAWLDLGLIFDF